jgi:tetratricopeptide (TPR) repeat protein
MRQTYAGTEICDYAEFLTAKASGDFKSATEKIATLTVNFPQNEEYLKEKLDLFTSGGNHSSASTVAEELLRIGYSDPKLLRSLAELYLKSGDTDRSKKYIDDYLGLYPGDITALGISGRIAVAGGNSLGAIEIFNKALKVNPGNPEIWKLRGNSFFSARAWDDAVKDYSMALDLNPSDSELWLNKGIAEISKGNTETGCYDLRKALSLGNKKASPHISKSCIN